MSQAKEPAITKSVVTEPQPGLHHPDAARPGLIQRIRAGLAGWSRYEARQWQRVFFSPAPFALLLAALALLVAAWQAPFSYDFNANDDLHLDQPFLKNFQAVEHNSEGVYFRWSKNEGSLDFPGIGRRDYRLEITVAGSLNPRPEFALYANQTKVAEGRLEAGMKTYSFEIPAAAISNKDGSLRASLKVEGFTPASTGQGKDSRELGFVFFGARLTPLGTGGTTPPLYLGWLLGAVLLAYALLARAGFGAWKAAGAAFGLALLPASAIFSPGVRIWLTVFAGQVALAFGWALLMLVLLDIFMRRTWGNAWERCWVLSIFGLALALRLAGLLHPHSGPSIVDLGFHLNRYADLWNGHQWWYKITSAEWGNRDTFYPLTTYLLMGPFETLIPDRRLLQLLWLTTFESSRVLLIYYLVRKAVGDGRAAVIAAFFMAALPAGMLSVAWGQVANLFGEWLILVALCLVVVKWEQLRKPGYFLVLTVTLLGTFIVHPGVVMLAGLAFLGLGFLLWRDRATRRQARLYLGIFALAVALAFASYHWVTVQTMVPQALDSLNSKLNGGAVSQNAKCKGTKVSGQVEDARLGFAVKCVTGGLAEVLPEGLKTFWREARVYFDAIPLLMLPWSLWWLWRTSRPPDTGDKEQANARRRLFWAGLTWVGVAVLFALVGLLVNLFVRYQLFSLPFVAIGAGICLSQLWQRLENMGRGRVAAFLTVGLCAWIAVGTLALFLDRLVYYAHG